MSSADQGPGGRKGKLSADHLYRGASGLEYHQGKRSLHPKASGWVSDLRAHKFQPHVCPEDKVFELGVGSGWNLAKLRCGSKSGYDPAESIQPVLRQLGIQFCATLEEVPDNSANVAICHHCLEHILSPSEALETISRILTRNGKLVLHVPWERERRYRRFVRNEPNHHLFTWNAQTLGNLLEVCGYKVEQIGVRRYGYNRFAANTSQRLGLGQLGFYVLRKSLIALRPLWEVEAVATSNG